MDAAGLLKHLIATPSFSRNEEATAEILFDIFEQEGLRPKRFKNNVWAMSRKFNPSLPTLLLNSHHDTVKPSPAYSFDPFSPFVSDGRLYGLGSNDAGASAVALSTVFSDLRDATLPFNLFLALTAEEEVTGENGMRAFLPHIADLGINIDMALVGEPTSMQPAIAERGLVVLDCVNRGVTGHAARGEGVNAIYKAIDDILTLKNFSFSKESEILGPITMQTTLINAGRQHNVVPDECGWTVDIRTTDAYSNEETVDIIRNIIQAEAKPRSTRIRASVIDPDHPLVAAAVEAGGKPFVSPTTSDMSQMAFPSLKMGPGESSRSHTADEFILLSELEEAIIFYKDYINNLSKYF